MSNSFADATMEEILALLRNPLLLDLTLKIEALVDLKVDARAATDREQLKAELKSELKPEIQSDAVSDIVKWLNTPDTSHDDTKMPASVPATLPRAMSAPSTSTPPASRPSPTIAEIWASKRARSPPAIPSTPSAKQPRPQVTPDDPASFEASDPEALLRAKTSATLRFTILEARINQYISQIHPFHSPTSRRETEIHIMGQAYGKLRSHSRCQVPGSKVTTQLLLLDFFRSTYKATEHEIKVIQATTYDESASNAYPFSIAIPK
jgi:hypothetical protein